MTVVEPRVVEGRRGWEWLAEGGRIFGSSPWVWIATIVVYAVVTVLVSIVPYVGDLGQSLLTPVFVGGMMVGCRALERGEPLRISHLFEGFQGSHFVQLMIIGAVNVALVIGLKVVTGAGLLGTMALENLTSSTDPLAAFESAAATSVTALLVLLVMLVVVAAFAMLNWFAPPLVALRGVAAVQAMKLSFVACLRNWVAFLVYGMVVAAAAVVLTIGLVVLALVFGAGGMFFSNDLQQGIAAFIGLFAVMAVVAIVLFVIVAPITVGSIYAGFKDTLDDADATVTDPIYK